jgi:outer membrane protein
MKALAIAASFALVVSTGTAFAQQPPAQPKPAQPAAPRPAPTAPTPAQPPATTPAQPPAAAAPAPPPQPPAPFPAGAKVAYINPQRIFQESTEGKAALGRVKALTDKKTTENQQKQKALADNQQKLQTSGSLLNDVARANLEKEIEKQQVEVQRFQQDAQAEIQELQNEVQREFAGRVQPIIDQIAQEKGLHLVFNMADAGLAWALPGLDISGDVIRRLDTPKAPATPPKP